MDAAGLLVTIAGAIAIVAVNLYFLGRRSPR
jgi:hypothetical protein